jgi:hypothetical protein
MLSRCCALSRAPLGHVCSVRSLAAVCSLSRCCVPCVLGALSRCCVLLCLYAHLHNHHSKFADLLSCLGPFDSTISEDIMRICYTLTHLPLGVLVLCQFAHQCALRLLAAPHSWYLARQFKRQARRIRGCKIGEGLGLMLHVGWVELEAQFYLSIGQPFSCAHFKVSR